MTLEHQDQMSIFDLLPEEEAKAFKSDEPTASKKKTKTTAPAASKEEPEPDVYEIDRVVYYAGHRLDVPSRTMKLEAVRAWLAEQFPELTKERCELVYDAENGHIVPVLKAHKKGTDRPLTVFRTPPSDPVPPVYHYLDAHGTTWEIRQTQTGRFQVPLRGQGTLEPDSAFQANLPKMPYACLRDIVARCHAEPDVEHLAYVVYDRRSGFAVLWPEQHANAVSVVGRGVLEHEDFFVVAHIHSHGRLPAFFSSTDDADEVRTGLYGVLGRCDKDRPDLLFRMSCGGHFRPLAPEVLFDGDLSTLVDTDFLKKTEEAR
ncbi:Mov34/MPN/PAD-1 family protein [Alicyclobacillus sp. SP_1]|uniref:Mov34/MPN/PAD-1 family protein n=1 Tax=Alicyclobacillus sp. SP_1 TaxID=2942475 RepID=UPI0021578353|nr:Mov34/MPN/PAD-1 family protein [Alicyclobacillus sp. SP_1]